MKKAITFMMALLFTIATQAQISPRTLAVLGCVGLTTSSRTEEFPNQPNDVYKALAVNADVGALYMLTNIIGIIGAVTIDNEIRRTNGDKTNTSSLAGLRLGARFYSPCMAPRFYAYAMPYIAMAFGNAINYSGGQVTQEFSAAQFNVGIALGLSYFLTPYIAMEVAFGLLNWNQNTAKSRDIDNRRTVNSELEFLLNAKALTVGFVYWFGRSGQSF